MKRLALAFSIAAAAIGIGACERQSSADLPKHYQHKGRHGEAAGHEAAPAHDDAAKAPAGGHQS